jgi:hypothetical protein
MKPRKRDVPGKENQDGEQRRLTKLSSLACQL